MNRSQIQVPAAAALFDGHFPGHPILPGAKLLDLIIGALQDAAAVSANDLEVISAKFLATVAPASRLELNWTQSADGVCRFDCSADGRRVATGAIRGPFRAAGATPTGS